MRSSRPNLLEKASPAGRSSQSRSVIQPVFMGSTGDITGVFCDCTYVSAVWQLTFQTHSGVYLPHRPFMALFLLAGGDTLAGHGWLKK